MLPVLLYPLLVFSFNLKRDEHQNSTSTLETTTSQTSSSATKISVNPVLPAGGVNLQTPTSISTTYVKSGNPVTFGWNYTSLIISPPAINIEVTCSQNRQAYTLAQNQSLETQSIVWDTNKVTDNGGLHLVSAQYTLVIYDASKSKDDIASAGELSTFEYIFGVYVPQSYQPWPFAAKYVNLAGVSGVSWVLSAFALLVALLL